MSRVPSLRDILNDIPDEVSDSDEEGEFENIEYVEPKRQSFLDIPEEYTKLNVPKTQNIERVQKVQNVQNIPKQNLQKVQNRIVPLTESNLAQINNEPLISYGIPEYESIETRSKKSHKSHKSHKSDRSKVSSIDFSVGEDHQNRLIKYDREEQDDTKSMRSSVSSLSMGSIKSQSQKPLFMVNSIKPIHTKNNNDNESVVSKISKKSHISVSSVSIGGSEYSRSSEKSIQSNKSMSKSRQIVPLSNSIYPKKMSEDVHGFNKFSNQTNEEEKVKVDVKRIKNIDEFKEKVNRYISLDDEIKTLSEALRERRKEKQRFEGEILGFMKDNEIETIKSKLDNSSIELIQRKKTEGLSKEYLMETLLELLKNKSTAENITNYIYEKRNIVQKDIIKRVVGDGGKRKSKKKY